MTQGPIDVEGPLFRQRLLAQDLPLKMAYELRLSLHNICGDGAYRQMFAPDVQASVEGLAARNIYAHVVEGLLDVMARVVRCSRDELNDQRTMVEQHLSAVELPELDALYGRDSRNLQRLVAATVHAQSKSAFHAVSKAATTVFISTARSWPLDSEMWDPWHIRELVTELLDELYDWAEHPDKLDVWTTATPSSHPSPIADLHRREWVVADAACELEHMYWLLIEPEAD